ncbi:unnamed protein product, partial [Caretta caretta]
CFPFGIGDGASTALIKDIARAVGGSTEFIAGQDRVQPKVPQSLKWALQLSVIGISLSWDLPSGIQAELLHWDPEVIFAGQRCLVYAQLREQPQLHRSPRHSHGGHHPAVPHPGPDLEGDPAVLPAATGWRQRLPVHRLAAKSLLLELEGAVGTGSEGDGRRALEASLSSGVVCSLTAYVGVDVERGQLVRWDVPLAG